MIELYAVCTILQVSCAMHRRSGVLTCAGVPFSDQLELDRKDRVQQAYRREQD